MTNTGPATQAKPKNTGALRAALASTPARIGVGRAGTRPTTDAWLKFRLDHALAKDAVESDFGEQFLTGFVKERHLPIIQSTAANREDYILFPPKGKLTDGETLKSLSKLCPRDRDVQIVVSDGLSTKAVEENVSDVLSMIEHGLTEEGISFGLPIVVRLGRVAIADQISHSLGARVALNLIGERPGLSCASSLSAYITFNPGPNTISSDRTVVSNIHSGGTPPVEAGAYIVSLLLKIFEHKVSGVRLQQLL